MTRSVLARVGLATAAVSALVAGCGDDGAHHAAADAGYDCTIEDRDDTFAVGLEKVGTTGMRVRITSAEPAPPQRGDNILNIDLLDAGGAPLSGAAVDVTPFMPDHRHGTSIVPVVTAGATPGSYQLARVNLWMPGLWEVTVEATPAGGATDSVVFRFCIAS